MTTSRKLLCAVYAAIALIALVGTWGNNLQMKIAGPLDANVQFWTGTLINPQSRSITVDILWLCVPLMIWMIQEARRLNMRFVWLYFIIGSMVAISVTFPVFMIQRERALAEPKPELRGGDIAGLCILGAIALVYTVFALR